MTLSFGKKVVAACCAFCCGFLIPVVFFALNPAPLSAQSGDWRNLLRSEKARNAGLIAALQKQGEPIAQKLNTVNGQIAAHNANRCEAPEDNPGACAAYDAEAARLNGLRDAAVAKLQPIVDRIDRLKAKNEEIDRKLRVCVQPPIACTSDSDCSCSQSCAGWADGARGSVGICQPSSH